MEESIKLYGSSKPLPIQKKLKAGDLELIFENGAIRYISAFGTEIIRIIYSAVRIEGWLTVEPKIVSEEITEKKDQFEVKLLVRYEQDNVAFEANYTIKGNPDNTLSFSMEGKALSSFKKCRIGFCVLHPLQGITGKPCTIVHSNGNTETATFPNFVSPYQPFLDISAMEWKMDQLGTLRLDFDGDTFETEDHRNWTDASFKTYCTPLSLPYPVLIEKGTKIKQTIYLKLIADQAQNIGTSENIKILINHENLHQMPEIGIGSSTRKSKLTDNESIILKSAEFEHLRAEIYTFQPNWPDYLLEAIKNAEKLSTSMELAVFYNDIEVEKKTNELANFLKTNNAIVKRVLLFHEKLAATNQQLFEIASAIIKKELPSTEIFVGTNANFAQLNRNKPNYTGFDGIVFSVHPQEHALDNLTITENIAAQYDVVKSAQNFSDRKPVIVSPVNIQRRFNANKEFFEQPANSNEMPWQVDTRLLSLYGAAWTAGSLLYLTKACVASATYFETSGERGIIQGDQPSRWLGKFPAKEKMIFPAYHILKKFNHWKKNSFLLIDSSCSKPLCAEAIFVKKQSEIEGLLFNYTPIEQEVELKMEQQLFYLKRLNLEHYEKACFDPNLLEDTNESIDISQKITLAPHEIIFLRSKNI